MYASLGNNFEDRKFHFYISRLEIFPSRAQDI